MSVAARSAELDRLAAAIHALPDLPRRAFLLARFEGYTTREIAEQLGCTVPEARQAIVAAIDGLVRAVDGAAS